MTTPNVSDVKQNIFNPLVEAAKPIFILSNTMQQTVSNLPLAHLLDQIALMINRFAEKAEANGAPYETVQKAKYCLCVFIDELAVHAKWADENWAQNSLLVSFYNETWGGERFFEILENLKRQPEKNIELLELMYICLQFGYKGKYHVLPNGDLQIDKIKRDLSRLFHKQNIHQITSFIHHSPAQTVRLTSKRLTIPLWVIASLSAVILSISFFIMQRLLSGDLNAAQTAVNSIKVTIPKQPNTPNKSKLSDNESLYKLHKKGIISISDNSDYSLITIKGDNFFPSGSTTIQTEYLDELGAIGKALENTQGEIIVLGYTDDRPIRGAASHNNITLSEDRANNVKEILEKYVTTEIKAKGMGDTDFVAPNDSEENRAKNRRVEIILKHK